MQSSALWHIVELEKHKEFTGSGAIFHNANWSRWRRLWNDHLLTIQHLLEFVRQLRRNWRDNFHENTWRQAGITMTQNSVLWSRLLADMSTLASGVTRIRVSFYIVTLGYTNVTMMHYVASVSKTIPCDDPDPITRMNEETWMQFNLSAMFIS